MTEAAIKARYDEVRCEQPKQQEVKARHILVEKEEEAKAIIEQLDGGADFAAIAKEKSTDPSARPERRRPRLFRRRPDGAGILRCRLQAGKGRNSTKAPVKSQFGWHVIKVDDKRDKQPPTLEETHGTIEQILSNELVTAYVDDAAQGGHGREVQSRRHADRGRRRRQAAQPARNRVAVRSDSADAAALAARARAAARPAADRRRAPGNPRLRHPLQGPHRSLPHGLRHGHDRRRRVHPLADRVGAGGALPQATSRAARRAPSSSMPAMPTPSPASWATASVDRTVKAAAAKLGCHGDGDVRRFHRRHRRAAARRADHGSLRGCHRRSAGRRAGPRPPRRS